MDTTTLAVIGTGLTAIGTAVALFAALWRVQGNRFDALERHIDHQFAGVDKQFAVADKRWTERFEMAEKASRERFEMSEKASRERLDAMDAKWTERLEGMDRRWSERFDAVDRQSQETHAAVCALNGRFDDLYRHLLGQREQSGQPRPAAG